jgi:hypothetical protein
LKDMIQPIILHPQGSYNSCLSHTFITILTAPKTLMHSSINSKSLVSSKYHINQVLVRFKVWFIMRQNFSLALNLWKID